MPFYTDPNTGTTYTSPEVARQYGVNVPNNQSSGVSIQEQTRQANQVLSDSQLLGRQSTITPSGNYVPLSGNVPMQPGQAVPVNQITPQNPLNLPQPNPVLDTGAGLVNGAKTTTKSIDQYLADLTAPKTPEQTLADTISGRIQELIPQQAGQAKALADEEAKARVPELTKELRDLSNQILTRSAEYDKLLVDTENNSNLKGSFSAKASQIIRTKASDIGLLNARVLAVQGNLLDAKDMAAKAVDLRYAPILEELNIKSQQLQALQPILDKEEKKQAIALERKYNDQLAAIQEEKAKSKINLDLAFTAGVKTQFANKGGEFFIVANGKPIKDPTEFFQLAGVSSFDEAYRKGLVTDVNSALLEDREFALQARSKYLDAGINIYDSFETVRRKILASLSYQRENAESEPSGFTLSPGQIRYDAAGNIVVTGGETPKKPLTEAQSKDVTYAQRTEESNVYIKNLEANIAKYNPAGFAAQLKLESSNLTNPLASDEIKQLRQAERNFSTAVLRRESGATISPSEFATQEKQYFPRPGDDAQTLRQKAQNRQTAIDNFKASNPNNSNSNNGGGGYTREQIREMYPQATDQEIDDAFNSQVGFNQAGKPKASTSVEKTMAAIGQFESGGNYKALGPKTNAGDRAYGKYQVMGANIPQWTKEALGRSLTPQQFLNDPKAQDAVARYKMGNLIAKGNGLEDVASIWFSGRPLSKAGNAKDIIGTSVPKYVASIRALYNKA